MGGNDWRPAFVRIFEHVSLQKGTIFRRPFFFLRLLDETAVSSAACWLEEEAESLVFASPAWVASGVAGFAAPGASSFTCCGGGKAWPFSSATLGLSSLGSGATLGLSSFGSAGAGGAAELSTGVAGFSVSERGAA